MSPRQHRPPFALVVLALALLLPAASSAGEAPGAPCPPPPATAPAVPAPPSGFSPAGPAEPAAAETIACVGSEAIDGATFSHWATVSRNSHGPPAKGVPAPSAAETRNEVLSFLITSDWVIGEARDLHVGVSTAQVRRQFDRVEGQQFPKRREFRAFLRSTGETVADLLFRVRLNLLSDRIQRHVAAGQHGGRSKARALERFVKTFEAKWRAQTYCAAQFDVQDCGHVQSVL
jgi:hypothetical protein